MQKLLVFHVRRTFPLNRAERALLDAGKFVEATPILRRWQKRSVKNKIADVVKVLDLSCCAKVAL